jgi:hypothetical protein
MALPATVLAAGSIGFMYYHFCSLQEKKLFLRANYMNYAPAAFIVTFARLCSYGFMYNY